MGISQKCQKRSKILQTQYLGATPNHKYPPSASSRLTAQIHACHVPPSFLRSKKPNTTDSVSFCLTCVVSAPRNKSHPCIADPSFASQPFSRTAPRRASRSCFFPFETRPKTATTNCGACANLGLRLLPDRGLCNRAWLVGVGWNKRLMPISGLGGVSGWWRAM